MWMILGSSVNSVYVHPGMTENLKTDGEIKQDYPLRFTEEKNYIKFVTIYDVSHLTVLNKQYRSNSKGKQNGAGLKSGFSPFLTRKKERT